MAYGNAETLTFNPGTIFWNYIVGNITFNISEQEESSTVSIPVHHVPPDEAIFFINIFSLVPIIFDKFSCNKVNVWLGRWWLCCNVVKCNIKDYLNSTKGLI